MTDNVRKAIKDAFELLGMIEQNPKRRYAVGDVRARLMAALGELKGEAPISAKTISAISQCLYEQALAEGEVTEEHRMTFIAGCGWALQNGK